ncbi:alpha/beta hydrolase fold domain-containing protein [Streptomyces siamensis]|uniref:alpha/beta hydrolase fold domain-containing protein n=1 Tax=Streptomyces siamensis TaxID=1274986 RepID=UPI003CD0AF87
MPRGRPSPATRRAGGNTAAVLVLPAQGRGDVSCVRRVLLRPVTDGGFEAGSCHRFAGGCVLRRGVVRWLWDRHTSGARGSPPVGPAGSSAPVCPRVFVVTAQAGVVRERGEGLCGEGCALRGCRSPRFGAAQPSTASPCPTRCRPPGRPAGRWPSKRLPRSAAAAASPRRREGAASVRSMASGDRAIGSWRRAIGGWA